MSKEFHGYSWLFVIDPLPGAAKPVYERDLKSGYHVFGLKEIPVDRIRLPLFPLAQLPELQAWIKTVFQAAPRGGHRNMLSTGTVTEWGLDPGFAYFHDEPDFTGVLAYDENDNFGAFIIEKALRKTARPKA